MIYVSGFNLFGQWFSDDLIFDKFRAFDQHINNLKKHDKVRIIQITWAYNILEFDQELYITGAWCGKQRQCVRMPLPPECSSNVLNLKAAGNDYNIVLACEDARTLWVIDLRMKNEIKKINFNIEEPLSNFAKKRRPTNGIRKAVILNDSCLYLTTDGDVYCGLLPSFVNTSHCLGEIISIQCGFEHFLLLTDAGRVYTWGNGRRLQLGHGDVSNLESPTEVESLSGIKIIKICAGGWHSLALSEFGDVYAWGWNDTGQLGIKQTNNTKESLQSNSTPTLLDLFDDSGQEICENIKDIACGSKHSVILLEDNSVWASGCNKYGQLGFSNKEYSSINSFKKVYQVNSECNILCGPWTSVIFEN